MTTEQDLIKATEAFSHLYWKQDYGDFPEWSEHWFYDGTISNHDSRGCYALFEEDMIVYIGVGIGKSFGNYHGSGLGDRLKNYWQKNDQPCGKKYKPRDKWKNITSIKTIGFSELHYCLAAALEIYLISKLEPSRNTQHK